MLHMNPDMHLHRSHLRDDLHHFDLRDVRNKPVEPSSHLRGDLGLDQPEAEVQRAPRRRWRIALRSPIYLRAVAQ